MGNLDVDSLLTKIPLEKTIEVCTNEPFKESDTAEGLSNSEFKKLLSLTTNDSHFTFDGTFSIQIDGVAMGSPLRPKLANAFLFYPNPPPPPKKKKKNLTRRCPLESMLMIYLFCLIHKNI